MPDNEQPTQPWLRCPQCHKSDELATHELVPGLATCTPQPNGSLQYHDETDMGWDDQTTVTNEAGETHFYCGRCDTSWFQRVPNPSGQDPADA